MKMLEQAKLRTRLGGLHALFGLACLLILASVFLQWRVTRGTGAHGPAEFSMTAWDGGLNGGAGLAIVIVVVLIGFYLLRMHTLLMDALLTLVVLGATFYTAGRVISAPSGLTPTLTYFSYGFYLAIVSCNLPLLYILLAYARKRRR
jgi:hypothetical protein